MIFYSLNTYLELNYLWYFSVFFFTLQVLLSKMFERLFLKEKAFKTFSAASADDIKEMWKYLELFGEPIGDNLKQAELNKCLKDTYCIYISSFIIYIIILETLQYLNTVLKILSFVLIVNTFQMGYNVGKTSLNLCGCFF